MRVFFCSSYTIRLCFKICWTKYVFPLCVGPTTKSENLWRKLNSGQGFVAKDAVDHTTLGFLAGGKSSLWLARFSPGSSEFVYGSCHDDTCACFRTCCLTLDTTQTLSCYCNKLSLILSVAADLYATRFTIGWRLASCRYFLL